MESSTRTPELEAVRRRRAEMHEALTAVTQALESGLDLDRAVDRLAGEFALHVEVTEGPRGLHQAILAEDLRLANQVAALTDEHAMIAADLAALVAEDPPDVAAVRSAVDRLVRHRQRGADLVYEAFATDLGGCD